MLKISVLSLALLLSSCFESAPVRVHIVDKSFIETNFLQDLSDIKKHQVQKSKSSKNSKTATNNTQKNTQWVTPIHANIFKKFSTTNKGITFNSRENQDIYAIADGKVVYSSNSLKSYGVMIIVKHNYGFYSHYMFNNTTLVAVGDEVFKGQKIATSGKSKFYLRMKKFTHIVNPEKYINF